MYASLPSDCRASSKLSVVGTPIASNSRSQPSWKPWFCSRFGDTSELADACLDVPSSLLGLMVGAEKEKLRDGLRRDAELPQEEVTDSSPESDITAVSVSWVQTAGGRLHRLTGA